MVEKAARKDLALPDEFSLRAYDDCASWSTKDWYEALSIRSDLFFNDKYPDKYWGECGTNRQEVILKLMETPSGSSCVEKNSDIFKPDWPLIQDQSIENFFIGNILVENFAVYQNIYKKIKKNRIELGGRDEPQSKHQYDKYLENSMPAWKIHYKHLLNIRSDAITDEFANFIIMVDLRAPDFLLKYLFENWLKKIRKETNIFNASASFEPTKLLGWHNKRLLPYLDLKAWSKLSGIKIKASTYCKKLFSDDPDGVEEGHIRKIVDKNAMDLVSSKMIYALQCDAYRAIYIKSTFQNE